MLLEVPGMKTECLRTQRGTLLTGHHGCDRSAPQLSAFHTTEPELKASDECDM